MEKRSLPLSATNATSTAANAEPCERPGGEESSSVPKCCQSCDYYKPLVTIASVYGRDCAAFGRIDGVKNDSCGLWSPRMIRRRTI